MTQAELNKIQVETTRGSVCGRTREGAVLFAGIPYAAPPVGVGRFAPPATHPGWSGVRDATEFGPAAPQPKGVGLTAMPLVWNEDCLSLNVTTPAADAGKRPVLVWIHGGAFRNGKGGIPWYDGSSFATQGDIVSVTLNYRLGALGYTHLGEIGGRPESAVLGLLDQIAALQWVQENIERFGGDPDQVTLAGESAGAMSVGTLLACPAARGLFHRAILQSGAAHNTFDAESARLVGQLFLESLDTRDIDHLRSLPVEALLAAQVQAQESLATSHRRDTSGLSSMAFQPAVDGIVVPEPPIQAIEAGRGAEIPILCGTNHDETTLWGYGHFDEARLQEFATRYFGDRGPEALATYRSNRNTASHAEIAIAITTDHLFRIPAIRLLESHAAHGNPAYAYFFTWKSRAFHGKLGSTHALEIPFTFNNLNQPGVESFLGEGPSPTRLAQSMHASWTAFVRSGNPYHDGLKESWPTYDSSTRATVEFGDCVARNDDPYPDERKLWDGIR